MNRAKILLWNVVGRIWKPTPGPQTALEYVREWWPEEILLRQVFTGPKRFAQPFFWWMKLVVLTLPKRP